MAEMSRIVCPVGRHKDGRRSGSGRDRKHHGVVSGRGHVEGGAWVDCWASTRHGRGGDTVVAVTAVVVARLRRLQVARIGKGGSHADLAEQKVGEVAGGARPNGRWAVECGHAERAAARLSTRETAAEDMCDRLGFAVCRSECGERVRCGYLPSELSGAMADGASA